MTPTNIHPDILNHPFFLAGRIFSVLETRNWHAKDKADAVKVSRFLSRAVSNPERVLGELCLLSEEHVRKLRSRKHRKPVCCAPTFCSRKANVRMPSRYTRHWPRTACATRWSAWPPWISPAARRMPQLRGCKPGWRSNRAISAPSCSWPTR